METYQLHMRDRPKETTEPWKYFYPTRNASLESHLKNQLWPSQHRVPRIPPPPPASQARHLETQLWPSKNIASRRFPRPHACGSCSPFCAWEAERYARFAGSFGPSAARRRAAALEGRHRERAMATETSAGCGACVMCEIEGVS